MKFDVYYRVNKMAQLGIILSQFVPVQIHTYIMFVWYPFGPSIHIYFYIYELVSSLGVLR
jgi:hypothetical protein